MCYVLARNTRFKYFVGLVMLGMLFFGMASIFLPLVSLVLCCWKVEREMFRCSWVCFFGGWFRL